MISLSPKKIEVLLCSAEDRRGGKLAAASPRNSGSTVEGEP